MSISLTVGFIWDNILFGQPLVLCSWCFQKDWCVFLHDLITLVLIYLFFFY